MLSMKDMEIKGQEVLQKFVKDLLEINGVSHYDRETYLFVEEDLRNKLYPVVHDIVFKMPVSETISKIRI